MGGTLTSLEYSVPKNLCAEQYPAHCSSVIAAEEKDGPVRARAPTPSVQQPTRLKDEMVGRWARVVTDDADDVVLVLLDEDVVDDDVVLVLLDDADVVVDEVRVLLDDVDVVDDVALDVLEDVAAAADDEVELPAFLYSSRRLPAPQYWNGVPAQVKLHSLSGAELLDGCGAWPQ